MKTLLIAVGLVIVASSALSLEPTKIVRKRQIYREQVLPHAGGKIPDTAFESDRLFLNRLQKEGIAIPDGVILETRNPQVFHYNQKSARAVFKVAQSSDGRYTPTEGRYLYNEHSLPSVDTTYLYPQIHDTPYRQPPKKPVFLKYRQIEFYNSLINQPKFHPKEKSAFVQSKPPKAYRYVQPSFNNIQHHHQPLYRFNHEGNVAFETLKFIRSPTKDLANAGINSRPLMKNRFNNHMTSATAVNNFTGRKKS